MNYNIFFNAGIHLSDPLAHLVFLSVYWLNGTGPLFYS